MVTVRREIDRMDRSQAGRRPDDEIIDLRDHAEVNDDVIDLRDDHDASSSLGLFAPSSGVQVLTKTTAVVVTATAIPTKRTQPIKRLVDLLGAVVLLVVFAPVMLIVGVAVRASDGGPALFRQTRCGRGGRRFQIYKFRTMVPMAEAALLTDEALRSSYQQNDFKIQADDPRVTSLGRLLRRTSLDELPQLFNVVRGQMSLVGPRPVVVEELPCYGDHQAAYESVRPGMTGPWQVSGRNNVRYPERAELDAEYARTWSLRGDLSILFRTAFAIFRTDEVV